MAKNTPKSTPVWAWRLGLTAGVFVLFWALQNHPLMQRLQWLVEDQQLRMRAQSQPPPSGEIVLVGIDEASIKVQGQWPFPRPSHGQLMDYLGRTDETRPAAFGWDILFLDQDFDTASDDLFIELTKKARYPVVVGAVFDPALEGLVSQGRLTHATGLTQALDLPRNVVEQLPDRHGGRLPIRDLMAVSEFGFLNADAGADGVVRSMPLIVRVGDKVYPSLTLQLLMNYWKLSPSQVSVEPGEALILQRKKGEVVRVPIDRNGDYEVNFRYELRSEKYPRGIDCLSYQGLDDAHPGLYDLLLRRVELGETIPPPPTAGKIVLVGQVASGLTDIGPSPLAGQSAKVLLHYNALENILNNDYLRRTRVWPGLAGLMCLGLGLAWTFDQRRFRWYHSLAVPVAAALYVALVLLGFRTGLPLIPVAVPLVAFGGQQAIFIIMKLREEQAQRDRIRQMFRSYVSPELVQQMVDSGQQPQLGGHDAQITAFFSDIQGFSSFSEVLSPADLVELLNEYLGAMTGALQEKGGALDKYIGDAIVAMFGGLIPLPLHARMACEAAVRMQEVQAALRQKWKSEGTRWPELVHAMRTRIGLNSGEVIVGNMGSSYRFNYTMMGDPVNLAARCESGAKSFGVYTMATENTVSLALAQGCECVFRPLDKITVKGRAQPVEIFEVVGLKESLSKKNRECLANFARGREYYLAQRWDEALDCFRRSSEQELLQPGRDVGVESNPSLVMIGRCETMRLHPPGEDWDGVYRMKTK